MLIKARYGSLTDFSTPQLSFQQISRLHNIRVSTVWNVVNSFLKNGCRIIDRRCFNHRTRRVIGTPELEEFLLKKSTL